MKASVTLGVCTFRRPQQLRVLLTEVARQRDHLPANLDLRVLVVDDDPQGSAAQTVVDAAALYGDKIHHHHAGFANLSHARNAVIEQGLMLGPWLAFIDDDCVPGPQWLEHLLSVQARTGADIVTGHVIYRGRPQAPAWLFKQPFCDFAAYKDAEEPPYGNTANVLLSTEFLRRSNVRFRPRLGLTGGEDMAFYADARAAGATLRYAASSVVYEELTLPRERLSYHLHRQFWLGNNMVVINRHTRLEDPRRMFLRGGKRVLVAAMSPGQRIMHGKSPQFRWALAYACQGLGLMLGVLGGTVRHRS